YQKTRINMYGNVFHHKGEMNLLINTVDGKEIFLKTSANMVMHDEFKVNIVGGSGKVTIESDIVNLNRP
ncbi:MAG: hypothetical protein C0433_08455, partial [Cyclobacterium sp.]|nr:hypothetical protein [Cyclobacterium sp.]